MTIKVTDTLIRHAKTLYNALEEKAEPEVVQGNTLTVFRGAISHVYEGLNISRSYYTPIIALLTENNCFSVLQKGSRSVESVIVLHHEPTSEGMSLPPLTGRSHGAKVESRLESLEKATGGINIVKALNDHEKRLKRLESSRRKVG